MLLFNYSSKSRQLTVNYLEPVPLELISYVLQFLAIHERLLLKATCKKFDQAFEPSLQTSELHTQLKAIFKQPLGSYATDQELYQKWLHSKRVSVATANLSKLYIQQTDGSFKLTNQKKQAFAQLNDKLKNFETTFGQALRQEVTSMNPGLLSKYNQGLENMLRLLLEITAPDSLNAILYSNFSCWFKGNFEDKRQVFIELTQYTWCMLDVVQKIADYLTARQEQVPEYLASYRNGLIDLYHHIQSLKDEQMSSPSICLAQ